MTEPDPPTETPRKTTPRKATKKAPPATASAPDPPPVAPPLITADQMRYLHVLLHALGLIDRADVLEYLSAVVGREVESRKDLTRDEAGNVIDSLQDLPPVPKPEPPTVWEALAAIKRELPAIGKNQRNIDQQYAFRGIEDVMEKLSPLLAKHGVVYTPSVEDVATETRPTRSGGTQIMATMKVRWRLYGPSGDWIEATTAGQGMDTSDKSVNKAATAAEKYMLTQVFAIPTRDYDADQFTPELGGEHPRDDRPSGPPPVAPPTTPDLLARLDDLAKTQGLDRETITAKWRHENGDLDVEALDRLQPEVLYPLVRQIDGWIAAQNQGSGYA